MSWHNSLRLEFLVRELASRACRACALLAGQWDPPALRALSCFSYLLERTGQRGLSYRGWPVHLVSSNSVFQAALGLWWGGIPLGHFQLERAAVALHRAGLWCPRLPVPFPTCVRGWRNVLASPLAARPGCEGEWGPL